jgi:hypothetical protein
MGKSCTLYNPHFPLEECRMVELAFQTYWKVVDLVQQGRSQQARELAVAIPIDHLRGMALLLANYSRRL